MVLKFDYVIKDCDDGRLIAAFLDNNDAEIYVNHVAELGIEAEIIHCTCMYKSKQECPSHGISEQLNRTQME